MIEEISNVVARLRDETKPSPVDLPDDVDPAVGRRRARHALTAVVEVLEQHPADDMGRCKRCRRRAICPAGELVRQYVLGWMVTGGLADRREGDPAAVSTRRLS
ncbi:hypothetical protein [Kineosporia succinea]|uniref:Uncharacterized protein n=1 Tax=Kineosporia succinea TaxID=84632 RepID=A0ABT9P5T2_9ACTN|nr:hypothetical protein [Kineosporia succinea]MDP9828027.1 hypothetical protein [Kineosporia succinea]